jgi:hypothetical protein
VLSFGRYMLCCEDVRGARRQGVGGEASWAWGLGIWVGVLVVWRDGKFWMSKRDWGLGFGDAMLGGVNDFYNHVSSLNWL